MGHPGFSLSVLLRYFVVPVLLLALATIWFGRTRLRLKFCPTRPHRVVWGLITTFGVIYGLMGSLRYLNYRTTIQDLGVYDQRLWSLSTIPGLPLPGQFISEFGHFSPILVVHMLVYKVYPSALVLIWLQVLAVGLGAYPIYRLARRHLGADVALISAAGYLLYPSVVFTVLFDFHPDHLLIPLLLLAFDLLDRDDWWLLAMVAISMLLIKESLVPTVLAFGVYAIVSRKRYWLGAGLAVGAFAFFALVIMPKYAGVFGPETSGAESYGYLGSNLASIIRTAVISPGTWLPELVQIPKLKFLFLMLAPLAFLPILGPSVLIVAAPGLIMALLSQHPHRYQIWTQYMAPIVPPLFVAAIFGFRRLASMGRIQRLLPRVDIGAALSVWLLGAGLYFNIIFSPSPLSTVFWSGTPEWLRWSYHVDAYLVTDRERQMRQALARYVPADPKFGVSSQNSVNSSHLAHRVRFVQFPDESDFIVVDQRRPPYLGDQIDPVGFAQMLEQVKRRRKILYESDGFFIFGPSLW